MSGYNEPKLMKSNREGVCALCANEIVPGIPIWWFNGKAYCGEHTDAEIRTEAPVSPSERGPAPSPGSLSTLRFDVPEIELRELNKNLDRICAAIDLQTDVLKGMRKDNNERR
jgi:hypothetical protein